MGILLRVPVVGGDALNAALAALQTLDELWLRAHPEFIPPRGASTLYDSGLVYEAERATEEWLTWPDMLDAGVGDCEDLAAARASELRVNGEDPRARAVAYQSGPRLWHAVVLRGDGTVEDPSMHLGMAWHRGVLEQGERF